MNIRETLVRLRDDIKLWVTNNLNALNAKIDEKTIPIDNELSSTSTNPVQNKAIKKAIDNIPTFSGDYNDLTNAPDISEGDEDSMVIADESGNIIFKADAEGIHTTALSLNGKVAATEEYVAAVADSVKEEISESIVSESDEWTIVDENGNIVAKIDVNGLETTAIMAQSLIVNGTDVESALTELSTLISSLEEVKSYLNI